MPFFLPESENDLNFEAIFFEKLVYSLTEEREIEEREGERYREGEEEQQ